MFTEKYERFRERLVAGRKAKDLTQMQVAERLGKPQSFVSKYERGERRLDLVEFLEVARAIGMDPKDLIDQLETVIEHDATSTTVPRIPKGTSGRALQ
jgi:transcriptional regulator with XRE-family HTH domain